MDSSLLAWQLQRDSRITASQIIEDDVHYCKAAMNTANNKKLTDLRMYYKPVESEIAEKVHHYESPLAAGTPYTQRQDAEDSWFHAPADKETKGLRDIEGTTESVPWYSPAAEAQHVPVCDLELARYLEFTDQVGAVTDIDLVVLLKGHQNILVRDKSRWHSDGDWLLPLAMVVNYCAVAWRVVLKEFRGPTTMKYFELRTGPQYQLIFLCAPKRWEACTFEWWSPLHQRSALPKSIEVGPDVCVSRGILVSDPEPLIEVVGRLGFGQLQKTALLRVARHFEIDVSSGDDLIEILMKMVRFATAIDDDLQILEIIKRTRVVPKSHSDVMEQLLDDDSVMSSMDRDDRQQVEKELREGKIKEHERSALKSEVKKRRTEIKTKIKGAAKEAKNAVKELANKNIQRKSSLKMFPAKAR